MKRKTVLWSVVVAAVAAAALGWAFAPRPTEVDTAATVTERFESGIEEDGRTRLRERYVISAPVAGRLNRITLREGDPIEAGMTIATLMPALPVLLDERARQSMSARVEAARGGVARAQARIERSRVALQQARTDLASTEQLASRGFVAATRLESLRLAERATRRELDAAVAEHDIATHDLEQARAELSAGRPEGSPGNPARAPFAVRAPVPGRVLRVAQPSEVNVAPGTPLMEIGDIGQLEIVVPLLTTDALQIRPQDRVIIDRWGGPNALEGRIARIEPAAFTKVSALGVEEQRVNVIVTITSPHEQWSSLGDGYRVSLKIVNVAQDAALQVPVSAVFPLPAPANPPMGVFLLESGRAHLRAVRLGARNGTRAWVTEGLKTGDTVIVYPPPSLREGDRVTPRRTPATSG
jgi:HlyD family secretion protein